MQNFVRIVIASVWLLCCAIAAIGVSGAHDQVFVAAHCVDGVHADRRAGCVFPELDRRRELVDYFSPDVANLEQFAGRELGLWRG